MSTVIEHAALLLLATMCCMFVIGMLAKDNSLIDIAYGPAFMVACWGAWLLGEQTDHFRPLLLLGCVSLWGARLGLHIGLRHRGRGEDFRYRAFRESWGNTFVWRSFLQIYMLQGAVVLVVALPVLLAIAHPGSGPRWTDFLGVLLFGCGFFFEAVGDWQLNRFKRDPAHRGRLIEEGLWRYTRHPNYFGDACVWWGLWLVAAETTPGLFAIVGPAYLVYTLTRWSGMPTVEGRMRRRKPGYEDYVRRTSPFFPWPPKPARPEPEA